MKEKFMFMKNLTSSLAILGLSSLASGGTTVLMDQIGPDDGSNIDTSNILANQYFEASFAGYDIAAVDDFASSGTIGASAVEAVIVGWNGYAGWEGVIGAVVNFYSSIDAACVSTVGDIYTQSFPTEEIDVSTNWTGPAGTTLIHIDLGSVPLPSGTVYVSVIPINEFGTNGQTGLAVSGFAGNLLCWQANPNGGFGFGCTQIVPHNGAYRVYGVSSEPCDFSLPVECAADLSGDAIVDVEDLLLMIGNWGVVGDGTFRPVGDIAPLPNGDCQVDVEDLLALIGSWGEDCQPRGACCFGVQGCTENQAEGECTDAGGDWLGEGSACDLCVTGACCYADGSCIVVEPADCSGAYQGDGTSCSDVICLVAPDNDTCEGAQAIANGDTAIDNTSAYSSGNADFTECDNFGVEDIFNDLWYSYVASCTGTVTISTCGTVDFDSRIAVYSSCEAGTMLACNDDCGGGNNVLSSELSLELLEGNSVMIRIGSFAQGAFGTGVLSVSCAAAAEGACCIGIDCLNLYQSDCADFGGQYNEGDCATYECGVANNTCETAIDVTCDSATSFDTTDATDSGYGEPDDTMCDGTYLDWTASPDVWFKVTMPDNGTADFSLCDAASYDTSLVLYKGSDCSSLVQIACNGDATSETGCQSYYSAIYEQPVSAGETYWCRIGGWQGATGSGTLSVTCTPVGATGACCLAQESCQEWMTSDDCDTLGGTWFVDSACADVSCPTNVACDTNGEPPTPVDGNWTAGTSDTGSGYSRAVTCYAPTVDSVTVYGLSLTYSDGWVACSTPDASLMEVALMDSGFDILHYSSAATYSSANLIYAGVYPLHGWTFAVGYDGNGGPVERLQVQSLSGGQGECWFLWMSADNGTSHSYSHATEDWTEETYGLNYCITE